MHHPVPDTDQPIAGQALAQEGDQMVEGPGVTQLDAFTPGLLRLQLAVLILRDEAGRGVDALDLPAQRQLEIGPAQLEQRELDDLLAVGHLAQSGGFDGRGDLGIDRIPDWTPWKAT